MNIQADVALFGKMLAVVLDVASLIPGINIPIGAFRLLEDGIQLEETAYALLVSSEGKPIRDAINKVARDLNVQPVVVSDTRTIKIPPGPRSTSQYPGYHWDIWQGWVKD